MTTLRPPQSRRDIKGNRGEIAVMRNREHHRIAGSELVQRRECHAVFLFRMFGDRQWVMISAHRRRIND